MVRREENKIDSLSKVIQLLSDGAFHSGAELGKVLGLTRSAIWKLTQQFQSYHIELESITGKGYRIPNGLSLLDKNKIKTAFDSLATPFPPSVSSPLSSSVPAYNMACPEIEIHNSLSSTNDYLMNKLPHTENNLCCLAERQTHGKGRLGRHWFSPFGRNIYLSLLWHFPCDLSELSGLSLVTAIALVKVLQQFGIRDDLGLKWPNDVLWKKQKLAGVLIEVSGETQNSSRAVIGIGVNVSMPKESSQHIDQTWTDISVITGKKIDRNHLVASILNELLCSLIKFQNEGFQAFMNDWKSLDLCFEKKVCVNRASTKIYGTGLGINEKGYFQLKEASGNIQTFSSGEISLRLNESKEPLAGLA